MVQVYDFSPVESNASLIGKALGTGLGKQLALSEAENTFNQAQGDPVKLATAMGRLLSASPDLARAAGPMYQAMLNKMQGEGLSKFGGDQQPQNPFTYPQTQEEIRAGEGEGGKEKITKPENIQEIIQGFRPLTQQQQYQRAGQLFEQNRAAFQNDPKQAIDFVAKEQAANQQRYEIAKGQHQDLLQLQDDVVKRLNTQAKRLGSVIPARVMSDIEEEAIEDVKGGMTEDEAMRKYGKKIDEISSKYGQIKNIGDHGLIFDRKQSVSSLKTLQKDFKKRKDLRNFADSLVANLNVSYPVAYSFADPIEDHPRLKSYLDKLPNVYSKPLGGSTEATKNIVEDLGKLIAESNASPQAVFEELIQKDYDPLVLKDYLSNNRDKLDLKSYVTDQLGYELEPRAKYLNDSWLRAWGRE